MHVVNVVLYKSMCVKTYYLEPPLESSIAIGAAARSAAVSWHGMYFWKMSITVL